MNWLQSKPFSEMEVFEGSGAEDDQNPHPEGYTLEWDRLQFFIGLIAGGLAFEDERVEKERDDPEDQREFDKENRQVLWVVGDTGCGLGEHHLADVMQVDATRHKDDEHEDTHDLAISHGDRVDHRLEIFLGNGTP